MKGTFSEGFLNEPKVWIGQWWVAGDERCRASGRLIYDPGEAILLEIDGSLGASDNSTMVIHGRPGGLPVTVWVNTIPGSRSVGPNPSENGRFEYIYVATMALAGMLVESQSQVAFDSVAIEVEHLGSLLPDEMTALQFKLEDGEPSFALTEIDDLQAEVGDYRYSLIHQLVHSFVPERLTSSFVAYMRDQPAILIEGEFSIANALEQARLVRSLVSFITGQRCGWLSLTLFDDDTLPAVSGCSLFMRFSPLGNPDAMDVGWSWNLFSLSDFPFDLLMPAWAATWAKYSAACGMLFALRDTDETYPEHRLISAVAAAEAMCGELGIKNRFGASELKRIKKTIMDSIPPEHRCWVEEQIQPRYSLRLRLEKMYERLPEFVRSDLDMDVHQWIDPSVKARDEIAHQGRTVMAATESNRLANITEAVITLIIMHDLGCTEEQFSKSLHQSGRLRIKQVRQEASHGTE